MENEYRIGLVLRSPGFFLLGVRILYVLSLAPSLSSLPLHRILPTQQPPPTHTHAHPVQNLPTYHHITTLLSHARGLRQVALYPLHDVGRLHRLREEVEEAPVGADLFFWGMGWGFRDG